VPLSAVNIAAAAYIFLLAISQLIHPDIGGSDALRDGYEIWSVHVPLATGMKNGNVRWMSAVKSVVLCSAARLHFDMYPAYQ
jgi:hypothetical protein